VVAEYKDVVGRLLKSFYNKIKYNFVKSILSLLRPSLEKLFLLIGNLNFKNAKPNTKYLMKDMILFQIVSFVFITHAQIKLGVL